MQDLDLSYGSDLPTIKNLSTIQEEPFAEENEIVSLAEFNMILVIKNQQGRSVKSMPELQRLNHLGHD